ncbi:MAG: alpha/beta fold hydrolase [Bacteroidota bacterium]
MRRLVKILLRTIILFFILINVVLAFHAYKFTHYYDAIGVTEKNPAEKTKWELTKDIVLGINAYKNPNKNVADTSFEEVQLFTKDKIQLKGWYIKTNAAPKGTVLLFHGHHSNRSGVLYEAEMFRQLGYNTMLIDFRAHGNSDGNTCTIGYREAEDVKLAYDFIKAKDEKNIILWGISMGAAAITKAVSDYQLTPSKIILEMPFGTLVEAAEGKLRMMHLPPEPASTLLIFWGGVENGFWAFNMKPAEFAKKITSPVLLQFGKNDLRVTRNEINDIYNNITAPKKLVVYENSGHESLCEKENSKWRSEVNSFLQ